MYQTILLAYDGSEHAQNALVAAAQLAKVHGATLHLVHTPQIDTPTIAIGSYVSILEVPPIKEDIVAAGQHVIEMATAAAKVNGVDLTEVHLCSCTPAGDILSIAEKINADLIVMGRRGLGAFGALTLGSVSQAVAHRAKCACLTVV